MAKYLIRLDDIAPNMHWENYLRRVQAFMAPSHTFDQNTLRALASIGITRVTDGYWLFPFRYEPVLMVPQIMERPRVLPVGVITFCLHLNSAKESFLREVEQFLETPQRRFISFDAAVDFEHTTMLNRLYGKGMALVLRWSRARRRLPAR
jgi:hypothetical protein